MEDAAGVLQGPAFRGPLAAVGPAELVAVDDMV